MTAPAGSHPDAAVEAATRSSSAVVYLNGNYLPKRELTISPDDRGFLLGDGVYEVLAAYDGRFAALQRHLDRLRYSVAQTGIAYDVAGLSDVCHELLRGNDLQALSKSMVYLQVTRGAAPRSHAFPKPAVAPTVYAFAGAVPPHMLGMTEGVGAITHPDMRWHRCDIKSTSLLANCLANQVAKESGAFEAILVRDGLVTEGSHTTVFAVVDGIVFTHPLSNLILAGVTREVVLSLCRSAGIDVREEPISESTLRTADEIFITGTTTEVLPVLTLDGKNVRDGKPGELSRRVAALYREWLRALQ